MGCCDNRACACRRGSAAGVVAKALTLLVLGAAVGAAHSVLRPIRLHADPTAPIELELPDRPARPPSTTEVPGAAADTPVQSDPTDVSGDPPRQDEFIEPRGGTLLLEEYITLDQARILWESGLAQFIDARRLDEHAAGHIPRSVLVDPADIRAGRMPEGLMFLDFEAITVIYCGGGDCDSSENAKRDLQQMGFTQLHIFRDGFPAWEAAGLPVNAGEPGASAPRPAPAPGGGA